VPGFSLKIARIKKSISKIRRLAGVLAVILQFPLVANADPDTGGYADGRPRRNNF
jgi:hypothetical protein